MSWITEKPIAHRGLHDSKNAPENSLPAFQEAVRRGFPIELDIHCLRDGEAIVFHDDYLGRLTGRKGCIWEQTSELISGLRLAGTEHRIPRLVEVLELVKGVVPILIEIKNKGMVGSPEQNLSRLLEGYRGEIAVQSFNPESLEWFKKNRPEILRGQLAGDFRGVTPEPQEELALGGFNQKSEPHFIAFNHRFLPHDWVESESNKRKIPVLAWTVRSSSELRVAMENADNCIFEGFVP